MVTATQRACNLYMEITMPGARDGTSYTYPDYRRGAFGKNHEQLFDALGHLVIISRMHRYDLHHEECSENRSKHYVCTKHT